MAAIAALAVGASLGFLLHRWVQGFVRWLTTAGVAGIGAASVVAGVALLIE
jgi:hypothetical protein